MKLFVLILNLVFCQFAFANDPSQFSGGWSGRGTYIYAGEMTNCSGFTLGFHATKTRFTFARGQRVCDKHQEAFPPVSMDYRDGKLFFNGQVVGQYDGTTLTATYRMPDGNSFRIWRMSMRREGQHLVYEESRTMQGETTPLISFAGLLMAQN